MNKCLAVFDFDHTIVNDNADTAVLSLIDRNQIPRQVKSLHRNDGWTAFMQGIFELLFDKGISESDIKNLVENLKEVDGMLELISVLKKRNYDIIIISDCNSYFIDVWLKKNNIDKQILKVFTNPAEFVDGLLKISMYHVQEDCKLSTKNLCKGKIMEQFIADQKKQDVIYEKIIYCGDGINDFCPILRLKERDLACVRSNYKCVELINKAKNGESFDHSGRPHIVKAEVLIWKTGQDIIKGIVK